MYIVLAILVFGLLILVHELGHFIVAKAVGVRVNQFSIGLGPRLFGKKIGETDFCVCALPIGGACVMEGEDETSEDDRAFGNKPVYKDKGIVKRAIIAIGKQDIDTDSLIASCFLLLTTVSTYS